jgi:hypothetical protein
VGFCAPLVRICEDDETHLHPVTTTNTALIASPKITEGQSLCKIYEVSQLEAIRIFFARLGTEMGSSFQTASMLRFAQLLT